ncbi:Piwi domain-containing protein [Phlebopus sp. FC_14]|nr:Piwi domain-containing protein [Phlebopus sp. FC_14]
MSNNRGANRARGNPGPRGGPPRPGGPSQGASRGGWGRGGGPPGAGASRGIIFEGPAPVDQRLSTSQQLLKTLVSLPSKPERPSRPGFGTLGQAITLRANFFATKFPEGIVYDYQVDISPTTDINRIKARLFTLLEQSNHPGWAEFVPFIAHDRSARLVAAKELPQPLDVPILFIEEGETSPREEAKTYTLTITLTQKLETRGLNAFLNGNADSRDYDFAPLINAYNLVLQYHASHTGVRVGKNRYFFPSSDRQSLMLSTGVEAWKGFFISARPVYKEMMVNVGVCMTAFYTPGNLADRIQEFMRDSRGTVPQRFAQKLKVTTRHRGYKQTKALKRIAETTAKTTTFPCEEFKSPNMTVEQYFKRKYNITLRYPNLPVADLSGSNTNYVPAELCEIEPGQPFRGKLNEKETAQMIRYACNPPVDNAHAIVDDGLPILGLTPQTAPQTLRNFGITTSTHMAVIPGRELPPPRLSYAAGKPPNVSNGSWNILDVKFHVGAAIRTWWVLVVNDGQRVFSGPDDARLTEIWRGFGEKCRTSGMKLDTTPVIMPVNLPPPERDSSRRNALDQIRQTIRSRSANGKPTFILVLLSKRDNFIYPGIKRICDVELGIHTLHMQTGKVLGDPSRQDSKKKQDQYFSNVALKLNTKLGGINHKLDPGSLKWLTTRKTMLVGMDVTHPGPGSFEGTPSIAAVVASVDSNFVQYPASLRCQKSKKEMIAELSAMMVERLQKYKAVSKSLPERVYVFRDGVSEGQFDSVIEEELPQILDAFKRVSPGGGPQGKPYRPTLSIAICGKRHHARFWPDRTEYADRNGNTRPGTVVDQGITSVFDFDFYLQAHAGLQGHVKATHYTVVYDENKFSADEIQQGINTSCYLYARATKAVSLVPPAYYADLACERGRCYLNDFLSADDKASTMVSSASGKGKGKSKEAKEEAKKKVYNDAVKAWGEGVHEDLRGSMFYI